MIKIYDGSNYFRVELENSSHGMPLRKLYQEAFENDLKIWVWDQPGNNERRRERFPDYKMNRKPPRDSIYEYIKYFQNVLKHSKAIQVMVPGYEGDDVVATLARRYGQTNQVGVYSNDFDFYQLTSNNIFTGARPKEHVKPDQVRAYKAFVGDPADNIKGIPGFGAKAWEALGEARRAELPTLLEGGIVPREWIVSPRCVNWLNEHEDIFWAQYDITGFYDVPLDLIDKYMIVGENNYEKGDALLKEYLN